MGIDLLYSCGDQSFDIRFAMSDWETIDQVRPHCPIAVATMTDVPNLGDEVGVPLEELRNAVEEIDRFLRDRPEALPYTYEFKCEYISVGDQRFEPDQFSTGGQSGFRLPGDETHWYAIWAGLDRCELQKMAVWPDGRGHIVEHRDLRNLRELQTSNSGLIQIRRRLDKSSLRNGLAEIRDYLETLPEGATVIKTVC